VEKIEPADAELTRHDHERTTGSAPCACTRSDGTSVTAAATTKDADTSHPIVTRRFVLKTRKTPTLHFMQRTSWLLTLPDNSKPTRFGCQCTIVAGTVRKPSDLVNDGRLKNFNERELKANVARVRGDRSKIVWKASGIVRTSRTPRRG